MHQDHNVQPDFGTSEKSLGIYVIGMILCIALTLAAFGIVMKPTFSTPVTILLVYTAAIIQFFTQIICFLRLNFKTRQGQINVVAFAYTGLILLCIIIGTLWIMYNLDYYMAH